MDTYKSPIADAVGSLAEWLSGFAGCEMEGSYAISDVDDFGESSVDQLLVENVFQTFTLPGKGLLMDADFSASSAIVASIMSSPKRVNQDNFELGFGLGSGFQIYCDDTTVITAGGGGGAGINWKSGNGVTSFGGGSGYGVQVLSTFGRKNYTGKLMSSTVNDKEQVDEFVSIGGGSGCGTCGTADQLINPTWCYPNGSAIVNANNITQRNVLSSVVCGDKRDENAIPADQFRSTIKQQYNSETFNQFCKHIRVSGGGGGGGGQVGCNYKNGGGFGFYFDLSCTNSRRNTRKSKVQRRVKQVPYEEISESPSPADNANKRAALSDWSAYRDFGPLVQAAVSRCSGYADWECVCTQARAVLNECAEIAADRAALLSRGAVNCTKLNQYNTSYDKILSNSCTTKHTLSWDNTKDSTNNSITKNVGEPNTGNCATQKKFFYHCTFVR